MELTLLTVPACPNAAAFEDRLAAALTGYPGAVVRRREVADQQQAAKAGMHGSPTLLIDGVDPFAPPGQPPSLLPDIPRRGRAHQRGTVGGSAPAGARSGQPRLNRVPERPRDGGLP
jgi:hypothetical protein